MRRITPGEWSVRQGGDHGKDPQAYDVVCVSPETGYPHPIARGFWGGQADMTLCSASPNLLAAAETAILALGRAGCQFFACEGPTKPFRDGATCFACEAIQKLNAAVAKARGKK